MLGGRRTTSERSRQARQRPASVLCGRLMQSRESKWWKADQPASAGSLSAGWCWTVAGYRCQAVGCGKAGRLEVDHISCHYIGAATPYDLIEPTGTLRVPVPRGEVAARESPAAARVG